MGRHTHTVTLILVQHGITENLHGEAYPYCNPNTSPKWNKMNPKRNVKRNGQSCIWRWTPTWNPAWDKRTVWRNVDDCKFEKFNAHWFLGPKENFDQRDGLRY